MAEPVKKKNSFDITTFTDAFAKQQELTRERQEAEKEALTNIQEQNETLGFIQKNSLRAKRNFVQDLNPLVDEFKTVDKARQRQMDLQSSGSFVDQLQAMQDAMLNPRLATSDGRARVRSEIGASIQMLSTMQAAQQDVFASQMDMVKTNTAIKNAKYDQTRLLEAQGNEVIQAEMQRLDTIRNGLTANAQVRELILSETPSSELIKHREAAVKTGSTEINGVVFPIQTLDNRIAAMNEIAYNAKVKQLDLAAKDQALMDETNNRILRSFTLTQTQNLKMGMPVEIQGPDGQKHVFTQADFSTAQIQAEIEAKSQAMKSSMEQEFKNVMFGDAQSQITAEFDKYKTLFEKSEPGTEAHTLASKRLNALNQTYNYINHIERLVPADKRTPEQNIAFTDQKATLVQKMQEDAAKDEAVINKAADRMGRGSPELKAASNNYLRGLPINEADARNYGVKEITSGRAPTNMFPPDVAQVAKKEYERILGEKRAETQMMDSIGQKELKELAANEAIDIAVTRNAQRQTDEFLGGQADGQQIDNPTLQKNPLMMARNSLGKKIFTKESLLALIKKSDDAGIVRMTQGAQYNWLQPTDIVDLQNGKSVSRDGKSMTPQEYVSVVGEFQNQDFLISLDNVRPGLADQYINWWNENGGQYAAEFESQFMTQGGEKTLQDSAVKSLSASQIGASIRNYQSGIIQSFDGYKQQQQKQRQQWISYDLDPMNRQAALLQFTPDLADNEKTALMQKVILPIIDGAKKQNLEYDATNSLVEDTLVQATNSDIVKNDPVLKKALAKVLDSRSHVVLQMEAVVDSPWLYGNDKKIADDVWNKISAENKTEEVVRPGGDFGQNLNSPRRINTGWFGSNDSWLGSEVGTKPYDWFRKIQAAPAPQ